MESLIILLHVLIAVAIIVFVLLQQGKGAEAGASFGAGASQTLFGSAGSWNFFSRVTAILALLGTGAGVGPWPALAYAVSVWLPVWSGAAVLRHTESQAAMVLVGAALAAVLSTLPFAVTWIDSRDGIFPADVPSSVLCEHSDPVQGAVPGLAVGSRVLIMSFSHAEDLDIVAACLARQRAQGDLPYVGLIGSKTKWATFRHRLEARGHTDAELPHITCPIGVPGIAGKAPEVIAVAVAAQLLQTLTPGKS